MSAEISGNLSLQAFLSPRPIDRKAVPTEQKIRFIEPFPAIRYTGYQNGLGARLRCVLPPAKGVGMKSGVRQSRGRRA